MSAKYLPYLFALAGVVIVCLSVLVGLGKVPASVLVTVVTSAGAGMGGLVTNLKKDEGT